MRTATERDRYLVAPDPALGAGFGEWSNVVAVRLYLLAVDRRRAGLQGHDPKLQPGSGRLQGRTRRWPQARAADLARASDESRRPARDAMRRLTRRRQRGAALFAVLVLLFVMGWFALSAFRISTQQLQIVGNDQAEQQATAAAQRAIDARSARTRSARILQGSRAFRCRPTWMATATTTSLPSSSRSRSAFACAHQDDGARHHESRRSRLPAIERQQRQRDRRPGAVVAAGDSLCANSEWNVAASVSGRRRTRR